MAVVKIVEYQGPDPHETFAWKFTDRTGRSDELSTWTQLIVREAQEAILFKNGQAFDLFTAGRHTLSTHNIPLLATFMNFPSGGKSPFKAEIWFVNKLYSLDIKWGTPTPIQIQDPRYGAWLPVRSHGQFGIRIADSRKFLIKLVGSVAAFNKENLVQFFRGILTTRIKDLISSYIVLEKKSILELNAFLNEFSTHMEETLRPILQDFGIEMVNFFVNSINVPDDDPAVIQLKNALAKRAEMDILGYSYQQQRSFDTLETAASNEGGGALAMQAGLGLGMGVGLGKTFGQVSDQMGNQMAVTDFGSCPSCRAKLPQNARFCPQCGFQINRCPLCGNPVPQGVSECPHCGALLSVECPHCKRKINPGMKFCPFCGEALCKVCSVCGEKIEPQAHFCPSCGKKIERD